MPDLNAQALDFLRCFNRAVRSLKMYKETHPTVQRDIDAAFASLRSMSALQDPVLIGVSAGTLVVQGRPVKDESPALKTFAEMLKEKNVAAIKASRGATRDEFFQLCRILFMEPEEALAGDAIKPELLSKLRSLQIQEVRFGAPAAAPVAFAGAAGPRVEDVAALAEAYLRAREDPTAALDGLFQEAKRDGTVEGVILFFEKAAPELARLPAEKGSAAAKRYVEQIALDLFAMKGVDELRNSILKTVVAMTPEERQLAFGESLTQTAIYDAFRILRKLDPRIRATALAADLVGGRTSPDRLRGVMESLAPAPDDWVRLLETAAPIVAQIAPDPARAADATSLLFRALKAQAKVETPGAQGTVLVLDPEAIGEDGYAADLEKAGFTVIRHGDGKEAYDDLGARKDVQCVVMEVKVPGLSGLEILNGLQDARRAIPVVVATEHAGFREAFEVASYPRLKYLMKPVDGRAVQAAIEAVLPPSAAPKAPELTPAELARLKELQAHLTPRPGGHPAPTLDGYDLAFRSQPTVGVGGDWFDVVPLEDGRTGFAVADASSRDAAGAMVLAMLRTALRSAARARKGAKETLVEANRALASEMPKGVAVSAAYAVLDPAEPSLTVAAAGYPPPLVWAKDFGMASFLASGKVVLGVAPDAEFEASLGEEKVTLAPRDRLLLFTNGLVEARDPAGAPFTERRFLKLVNFAGEKSSAELVEALFAEVSRHRGGAAQSDDATLLCLTRGA